MRSLNRPLFDKNVQIIKGEKYVPKTADELGLKAQANRIKVNKHVAEWNKKEKERENSGRKNTSYGTEATMKSKYDSVMKHGSELEKMKMKAEYRKY